MTINAEDLIGQKFGKLTVKEIRRKEQKYNTRGIKDGFTYYYLCECECGNIIEVDRNSLRFKRTQSCGCLRNELSAERKYTHKLSGTKLYQTYNRMKTRCYNKNVKCYKNYGLRGIKICNEWLNDFASFYNWSLNNGYKEGLSIDRIDVNGDYEPSNCRWITMAQQASNKRNNHYLTHNGETKTIAEWSRVTGISYHTLKRRINNYNWTVERALTKVI